MMSRKGGEVTVSATEPSAISGVSHAGPVHRCDCTPSGAQPLFSSVRDFLRISAATSRSGGETPSFALILRWASIDTAWLGGIDRPEKKPGEWPTAG